MSQPATMRERVQLLAAAGYLAADAAQQLVTVLSGPVSSHRAQLVRVRVSDLLSGRLKATVTVPVGLCSVGLRLGARLAPPSIVTPLLALIDAAAAVGGGRLLDWRDAEVQERFELVVE